MILTRERSIEGHVERVIVSRSRRGWEVSTERDGRTLTQRTYTDWHRVELALRSFDLLLSFANP